MEKLNPNKLIGESPFFNALEQAEAIQVREISSQTGPGILSSLENALRAFDEEEATGPVRSFLVQIAVPSHSSEPVTGSDKSALENSGLVESAQLLLEAGDFLLARSIYSFLLKTEATNLRAQKGMGICLLRLGDTTSAKKCFQTLLDSPLHDSGLLWISHCQRSEKNEEAALATLLQVASPERLDGKEERFQYHKEFGNILARRGDYSGAASHYQSALAIEPDSDTIYVNLGTLEIQKQDWKVAENHFERARALHPKNSKAICGLGLVAHHLRDTKKAKAQFEAALDLDSQNQVALLQLLNLSHRNGDYSGVKNRLCRFLIKEPNNGDVRYALATLLFKDGDWLECDREIELVLAKHPNHSRALKLREDLSTIRHGGKLS